MQLEPRNPFLSPRFGQIATFMLLPAASSPAGLDVALIGVPYDGGTSYRPGARFGPRAVREQSSLIRTWNPVLKVHPFQRLRVADCGDIDVVPISIERTFEAITAKMDEVVAAGAMPLCVGGDHSVTLPILRSVARRHGPLGIVHFDAHPDTWDEYFGSKFFHGTPFRRGVEEGLIDPRRMIQVGIRGPLYGPEDFAFHEAHGLEVIRIEAVKEQGLAWVAGKLARLAGGPVYCSFVHRRGGPGLPPPDGHARGRRARLRGGRGARKKPPGPAAGWLRSGGGAPAVRRAGPDHFAPGRQPALRIRLAAGARPLIRVAVLAVVLLGLATPASAAAGGPGAPRTGDGGISPPTGPLVTTRPQPGPRASRRSVLIPTATTGALQ